jgi:hypothetical protein
MINLKKVLTDIISKYKWEYEIYRLDRYRRLYDSFSFSYKNKKAAEWLIQYPEQAHFNYTPIKYWLENLVTKPTFVLEIGGWRGDHSSHVLDKAWEQIVNEMKNHGFSVDFIEDKTYIFKRLA